MVTLAHLIPGASHLIPVAAAPPRLLSHGQVHLKIVWGDFESVHGIFQSSLLST